MRAKMVRDAASFDASVAACDGVAVYQRWDYAAAYKAFKPLAEQGDADAQLNLGVMFAQGLGVPQNHEEAVKWYRKAAEQGHAAAQNSKAAEQGHAAAQNNLGVMHVQGRGVPRDDQEAVKWFRKAAEQGFAKAQNALGLMYAQGRGVPRDDQEAVRWYRKAAEQGFAVAQSNLGWRYKEGQGVPQSNVVAYALYDLSAANGNENAKQARDRVSKKMTDEEIAAAQALTRELSKPGNFSKALDAATRK